MASLQVDFKVAMDFSKAIADMKKLIETMESLQCRENGDEPEPARGDIENRGGADSEVQPAEDVGQAETAT